MDAKLNQSDLISLLAKGSNISMSKAELFTKNFFELIIEGLEQDGIVKINGLGTFKVTEVASRGSVNVNTGEKIEIKGHKKLVFIPADTLKESVNQPFAMFEPVEVDETYQPEAASDVEEDETTDEITEETVVSVVVEEPLAEETLIEPQAVEDVPVEEPIVAIEPQSEAKEEAVTEPETTTVDNVVIETEQQKNMAEPQTDEVTVPEIVVEEKTAEPVIVRVPEKKKLSETAAVKKRKPMWIYAFVALVVIIAAYFGFTIEHVGNTSKENTAVAEVTTPVVAGTKLEVVAVVEPTKDTVAAKEIADTDDAVNELVAGEEILPIAKEESKNTTEPENRIEKTPIKDEIAKEEYVFTIVDELASTRLKDIGVADTTLYVAEGEYCQHIVAPDETLTKIAKLYFGDKKLWPYIVKYNNMDNPNALRHGMEIRIPRLVPRK